MKDREDGPVGAPETGLEGIGGGFEGVVGESEREEEGECGVDEAGQHGL